MVGLIHGPARALTSLSITSFQGLGGQVSATPPSLLSPPPLLLSWLPGRLFSSPHPHMRMVPGGRPPDLCAHISPGFPRLPSLPALSPVPTRHPSSWPCPASHLLLSGLPTSHPADPTLNFSPCSSSHVFYPPVFTSFSTKESKWLFSHSFLPTSAPSVASLHPIQRCHLLPRPPYSQRDKGVLNFLLPPLTSSFSNPANSTDAQRFRPPIIPLI